MRIKVNVSLGGSYWSLNSNWGAPTYVPYVLRYLRTPVYPGHPASVINPCSESSLKLEILFNVPLLDYYQRLLRTPLLLQSDAELPPLSLSHL